MFFYGDEDYARIHAMHLMPADRSEIRRVYLVPVRLDLWRGFTVSSGLNLLHVENNKYEMIGGIGEKTIQKKSSK